MADKKEPDSKLEPETGAAKATDGATDPTADPARRDPWTKPGSGPVDADDNAGMDTGTDTDTGTGTGTKTDPGADAEPKTPPQTDISGDASAETGETQTGTTDDDFQFADPISDTPPASDEVEPDDTAGTSLSARILQGLALIAIGIGIALWAAPRVAPMLPAGLSPVADFLMPGQRDAQQDIARLRADMDTRLAALSETPAATLDDTALRAAIAEYDASLQEDLAAIRDQLSATDGQEIEARLAAVETRLQGITAELTAVSDRLSRQITENGVALSEEASSRLSGYQAALEGLRAEVADLAARNGALSQKVEEIASAARRRVAEAEAEATTRVANTATRRLLTEIDAALDSGAPFASALSELAELTSVDSPAALLSVAADGTPSWSTLRNQFGAKAHAALRADAAANAGNGLGSKLGAFLRTQVGTRSLERRAGDDADAVLSRVEDDLTNRRLDAALAEARNLPEAAAAEMAGWIGDLQDLAEARAAFTALADTFGATE